MLKHIQIYVATDSDNMPVKAYLNHRSAHSLAAKLNGKMVAIPLLNSVSPGRNTKENKEKKQNKSCTV